MGMTPTVEFGVMPKEGLAGLVSAIQAFFWYDSDKNLYTCFSVTQPF